VYGMLVCRMFNYVVINCKCCIVWSEVMVACDEVEKTDDFTPTFCSQPSCFTVNQNYCCIFGEISVKSLGPFASG
jgi:hypothetical protein